MASRHACAEHESQVSMATSDDAENGQALLERMACQAKQQRDVVVVEHLVK